jgi:hypothetical protein
LSFSITLQFLLNQAQTKEKPDDRNDHPENAENIQFSGVSQVAATLHDKNQGPYDSDI